MSVEWTRPENVPFPNVWMRFEGKKEVNGKIPKFWIQDIPEERFDEVVDFMCKNFVYEEPLCKYLNIYNDPAAIEEGRQGWRMIVSGKLGLVCFMENPEDSEKPIMVAVNITCIKTAHEDDEFKFNSEKMQIMVSTIGYVSRLADTFKMAGSEAYLSAVGLSVLPEFRGQGIGEKMLLARTPLCKAMGLAYTFTAFTSKISQNLAERTGFKDALSIPFDDLKKVDPRFVYPGITEHTKNLRLMYKRID